MAFTAKTDPGIRRSILDKNRRFNRTGKARQIIDILGMHVRGMAIAVLGLNPHAGDNGTLGTEEIDQIIPGINEAYQQGILAFGPFSPDGFFSTGMQKHFDAVLAMYHDQGLIPFKALSFDDGVNFTAGLPIVRTSPDHGTAFDIAGKCLANPGPMITAIHAAVDICHNRAKYDELTSNPLEIRHFEGPKHEKTILPE